MTIMFFATGCGTPKPGPDPLEGWNLLSQDPNKLDGAIRADYRDYIQKLPAEERRYVQDFNIRFVADGTGRHAVRISIPDKGIWWEHILIYDQNNQRVQAIKRISGYYQS